MISSMSAEPVDGGRLLHSFRRALWSVGGRSTHLMRHCRGANFSCNSLLLEVSQADVSPHIPVKVQKDGVEAHDHSKQLSNVVMGLYLQILSTVSFLMETSSK